MSLRDIKITVPTYHCVIPSTKKKVKFRAFNVGDEKALLMASESKDTKHMVSTVKDVLRNCVDHLKLEELAPFDIEYLFIKLRAVSVGETATIGHDCPKCNHRNKIDIDLNALEIKFHEGHEKVIKVTPSLGFEMKYPDIDNTVGMDPNDPDTVMKVIASAVKSVYNGEDVIDASKESTEDIIALLEQLPSKQFQDIQHFFNTMPSLSKDVKYTCHNCKTENDVHLEGIADFF